MIVSISVAETLVDYMAATISAADGSNSFRVMRALRLARTLRGVRIIRVFRYFSVARQVRSEEDERDRVQEDEGTCWLHDTFRQSPPKTISFSGIWGCA